MTNIDDYCKLINVTRSSSLREIQKAYNKLAIKYHPALPRNRCQHERFINIFLAYDMLTKINAKRTGQYKTKNELFDNWINTEKSDALEKANYLSKLSMEEFERTIFKGFNRLIKITYGIFMTIASFSMFYLIKLFIEGKISFFNLFIISGIYTFPLFMYMRKVLQREDRISQRIKMIKTQKIIFINKTKKMDSFDLDKNKPKLTPPNNS